jgi:Glycosyltransferase 99 family N-terminal domain/Glycosyl transferases group 1
VFVSFLLPSIFEGVRARHLLVFYKQLAAFGRDEIAFVGEPDYFRAPGDWRAEGRGEWQQGWQDTYEFSPPDNLDGLIYQALPANLFAKRLAHQSSWNLYAWMSRRRMPELEAAFSTALDALETWGPIDAILTVKNVPSIDAVARARGLEVIHCEFGPVRKPGYAMTGYWDLRGVGTETDAPRRFTVFQNDVQRGHIPILTREQLLRLLRRAPLPQIPAARDATFRVGLGLQGEDNTYAVGLGPMDLVSWARRHVDRDELLIRHHGGAQTNCSDQLGVIDKSATATEFIAQCQSVMTVTSGMALEALLLGRQSVVIGDSPFQIASARSLSQAPLDAEAELIALNFLALGYVVPLDLVFNAAYSRWRLTGPSESEIAERHRTWYEMDLARRSAPAVETASSVATIAKKESILLVYPFCLDHVGHGNIQRILNIARYLAGAGFEVDLVYQGSSTTPRVDAQYAGFRHVITVEAGAQSGEEEACERRLTAFYSGHEPPAHHLRPSAALTSLVRALIGVESYCAVMSTYAWTAPIFAGLSKKVLTICDVQDIMHEHSDACHRATGQSTTFSLPESTEAFLWRKWDVLLAITPDDEQRIERDLLPRQRLMSVRHAASSIASAAAPGLNDIALYAASDNASNVQSAKWLLDEVWPLVRQQRPSARLRIAGLVCRALPESAQAMPGVEIVGFKDNLNEEIERAGIIVAPYLYGSGLKIKVVEAACAGKATITTTGGWFGTGFEIGRGLEVHDEPAAFAAQLTSLLASRKARAALGAMAIAEASRLFSAEANYRPIVDAIGSCRPASVDTRTINVLSAPMVDRVSAIAADVRPRRIVIWGNGSHTRSLIGSLESSGTTVQLIVDGRGRAAAISPEGLPVLTGSQFKPDVDDLIVLSSEVFERDMWEDLAACRNIGGMVLGVYYPRHISDGLMRRLSSRLRVRFGASAFEHRRTIAGPAIVLWDSHATPERTWRLRPIYKISSAMQAHGTATIVVTHASVAEAPEVFENSGGATVVPILEIDTRAIEAGDTDVSAQDRERLERVVTSTVARSLDQLALGRADTLVLLSPSPTEVLAVAHALSDAARRGECPAVAVELSPLAVDDTSNALDHDRLAALRAAIEALAEAVDDRLVLVSIEAHAADRLRAHIARPIHVMPVQHAGSFLAQLQTGRESERPTEIVLADPTITLETLYATAT